MHPGRPTAQRFVLHDDTAVSNEVNNEVINQAIFAARYFDSLHAQSNTDSNAPGIADPALS
jgi:hypothetical protein